MCPLRAHKDPLLSRRVGGSRGGGGGGGGGQERRTGEEIINQVSLRLGNRLILNSYPLYIFDTPFELCKNFCFALFCCVHFIILFKANVINIQRWMQCTIEVSYMFRIKWLNKKHIYIYKKNYTNDLIIHISCMQVVAFTRCHAKGTIKVRNWQEFCGA